jgi:hypothetical protein
MASTKPPVKVTRRSDLHCHVHNPCRTFRLKVPEAVKRALVGVRLHLRYEDQAIVVNEPNQVLTAPEGGKKKGANVYTCAALDSALSRYLGELWWGGTGRDRTGERVCCRICLGTPCTFATKTSTLWWMRPTRCDYI